MSYSINEFSINYAKKLQTMTTKYRQNENNDIIYVEKRTNYASEVLKDVTPIVSLITTFTTLIFLGVKFGK